MTELRIDDIIFDDPNMGLPRNPGALDIEWWYDHRVIEYKIPGYKDMTQVTSNKVLLHCRITIRTTDTNGVNKTRGEKDGENKFDKLKKLIASTGPYVVKNQMWGDESNLMYLKGSPKYHQIAGEEDWVGVWTLEFVQKYDG